jgi:hypothetical protein
MLPAHLTSGGKAVLAARPDADVVALYTGPAATADPPLAGPARPAAGAGPDPPPRVRRQRRRHRARGHRDRPGAARSRGPRLDGGVHRDADHPVLPRRLAGWARSLAATAQRIEDELAAPR